MAEVTYTACMCLGTALVFICNVNVWSPWEAGVGFNGRRIFIPQPFSRLVCEQKAKFSKRYYQQCMMSLTTQTEDDLALIPDECIVRALVFLEDVADIKRFQATCKRFRDLGQEPEIWKQRLRKDFDVVVKVLHPARSVSKFHKRKVHCLRQKFLEG